MTAAYYAKKLLAVEVWGRRLWRVARYRSEPLFRPQDPYKGANLTLTFYMKNREVSMEEAAHAAMRHEKLAVTAKLTTIKYLLDDVIEQVHDSKTASKLDQAWILLEDARRDLVGPEYGVKYGN